MTKCFDVYSRYYDLLYRDKDYNAEVSYVSSLLKKYMPNAQKLLDVGCGTGKHAFLLSQKGYSVDGLDIAEGMLKTAQQNYPQMKFYHGDARNFEIGKSYDAIISLFHVASYQTSNSDVKNYFHSVRNNIIEGGFFIFDFWYGPAVISDRPVVRIKRLEDGSIKVKRIAKPIMYFNENIVDVNFEVLIENKKNGKIEKIEEKHKMRYFFLPEIELLLQMSGFEMIECFEWMNIEKPTEKSWNVCMITKRIR